MHIKCRNWPRLPVACGDKHSILSGKGIRGQPLDVPVPYNSGFAQECGKGEVRVYKEYIADVPTQQVETRAKWMRHIYASLHYF